MNRRKICVVTGTRAEYGLLYWLMKEIDNDSKLQLQIIATGMHLSPEFGLTYQVIEQDGFKIDEKVEMLLSSDTPVGIAKSIGLGVIGFADAFARLKPDIVVLLGDRYEILAAAQAALVARIPVAHIAGGDITEGAFDDAIRHSLTKMSHLHFVTNQQSGQRVRQMGENPAYIYVVGNPGLDHLHRTELLSRKQLEESLSFNFREKNLLITYHAETLGIQASAVQFEQLLQALDNLKDMGLIFTKPNSDPEGRILAKMVDEFVSTHANAASYISLGQKHFLSTIVQVDAVVGNSSSGLYEVPSFKKPTVNIGDRQKGRLRATSVIDCEPKADSIAKAIEKALMMDCSNVINPYGDGNSSKKIIDKINEIQDLKKLVKKVFHEVVF